MKSLVEDISLFLTNNSTNILSMFQDIVVVLIIITGLFMIFAYLYRNKDEEAKFTLRLAAFIFILCWIVLIILKIAVK